MSAVAAGESSLMKTLAEAASFRLAGVLLERPCPGWLDEIAALSAEPVDEPLRKASGEARQAGEGFYLAVFGPGGAVSPREVSYRGSVDPARVISGISAFHRAFAFAPRTEEPVDHIAVLGGFAGYLALKEAFALSRGAGEEAEIAREARRRFIEDHLRPCAGPLARRLEAAGAGYLAAAARALVERVGDSPEPTVAMMPGDDQDAPVDCGGDLLSIRR